MSVQTDEALDTAYRAVVTALREAVAAGTRQPAPLLLAVRARSDGELELLTYDLLDARQHLYAMRAAWSRDDVAGFVFGSCGEVRFTDQTVPTLMTVLATPLRVVAEMHEVTATGVLPALRAPVAAEAAYADVFNPDIPLQPIRAPQTHTVQRLSGIGQIPIHKRHAAGRSH